MNTQIPKEVVIWKFGGKTGNLKSQNKYVTNSGYHLFCSANNQYLTYGKEPFGINLIWATSNTDKKVHFHLPDNKEEKFSPANLSPLEWVEEMSFCIIHTVLLVLISAGLPNLFLSGGFAE